MSDGIKSVICLALGYLLGALMMWDMGVEKPADPVIEQVVQEQVGEPRCGGRFVPEECKK